MLEAGSGFEALRLLPAHAVDLIVTDINMPDINGLELISFVRASPNYRRIPVIIISGHAIVDSNRVNHDPVETGSCPSPREICSALSCLPFR